MSLQPGENHFLGKINVKALFEKDGKVLLTRDHNDPTWDMPGGRVNVGEDLEQAIRREVLEELGVEIKVLNLFWSKQWSHTQDPAPHFYIAFIVEQRDPSAGFKVPSEELEEVRWVGRGEIENFKMYPNTKQAVEAFWKLEK